MFIQPVVRGPNNPVVSHVRDLCKGPNQQMHAPFSFIYYHFRTPFPRLAYCEVRAHFVRAILTLLGLTSAERHFFILYIPEWYVHDIKRIIHQRLFNSRLETQSRMHHVRKLLVLTKTKIHLVLKVDLFIRVSWPEKQCIRVQSSGLRGVCTVIRFQCGQLCACSRRIE